MKRRHIGQVVLGLLLILAGTGPIGAVVYVDDDAPPGGDGSSWAAAYRHLQDILIPLKARSSDAPIEIRVAQGIYRPDRSQAAPDGSGDRDAAFEMGWGVQVFGGCAGVGAFDPNERDVIGYPTILSGDLAGNDADVHDPDRLAVEPTRADNSQHVAVMVGTALLDGVTLTGGQASAGTMGGRGAITPLPMGGAIEILGGALTIRDCVFTANFGRAGGGAVAEAYFPRPRGTSLLVTGCIFEGNATGLDPLFEVRGGAIVLSADRAVLTRCVFRDNRAAWGACVACVDAEYVAMVNCLAVGNIAGKGGAVLYHENGSAAVRNCTSAGNRAPLGRFLLDNTARPERGKEPPALRIDSCILADDDNEISNGYTAVTIQYSDVVGGKATIADPRGAVTWGPGNIDADPCFADAGRWDNRDTPGDPNDDVFVPGDYHLKSRTGRWDLATTTWVQDSLSSPCIDTGNPTTPFEEEHLPNGKRVNLGCYGGTPEASKSEYTWRLVTTQGPLSGDGLGVILPHEHIFTDLRGPTVAGYGQADPADVVRVMKPWLVAARQAGVGVLVECSSIGVGRNVAIIDRVARESGLPVVVPTGVYGRDNFAPPEHRNMTEDELTTLFIKEIREGIEGTDVKAGFIKIATGSSAMTALEEKFLRAAGRAARETGAAIASHTPLGSNASRQVAILESLGTGIRFIWVHAQSESNRNLYRQLAARGVYIEFDSLGANPGQDSALITAIQELLAAGYGGSILLSHDAGWYQPGQANGGTQRSYAYLIDTFIPKLRTAGVDEAAIRMITEINPVRALGFRSGP